jgi:glycosyltransferase involved in cell wall biosynthesis
MGVLMTYGECDGPAWYRAETPARWLRAQGVPVRVVTDFVDEARGDLEGVQQFAGSRLCDPTALFAAMVMQQRGIRVVYDIDDHVWAIPDRNVAKAAVRRQLKTMTSFVKIADCVTTATERLADELELLNWRVQVIPNALPPEALEPDRPRSKPGFRIGWAGSVTHVADLELLAEPLAAVLDRCPEARLVFMGYCPPGWVGHPRVEVAEWVQVPRYYQALRALELDVFVAPLVDDPFNRCKSDLKLLEAGIMGWPILCSNLGPYADRADAVPALRVGDTRDWVEALLALVDDLERRNALGARARDWVRQHRMIEHVGRAWLRALALDGES